MPTSSDRPGALFSDVYFPRRELLRDDARGRRRLAHLVYRVNDRFPTRLGDAITGRLGIDVPFGYETYLWDEFFADLELNDVLNVITIIYEAFRGGGRNAWKEGVQEIFEQQGMAYRVDEQCGVRFRHDAAFETARVSVVRALDSARLNHVADALDSGLRELDRSPPNLSAAVRGTFFAAEEYFKLRFAGVPRLAGQFIDNELKPVVLATVAENRPAEAAMKASLEAFKAWVTACHNYRHASGDPEPQVPPEALAISLVSNGVAWIRWLVTTAPLPND